MRRPAKFILNSDLQICSLYSNECMLPIKKFMRVLGLTYLVTVTVTVSLSLSLSLLSTFTYNLHSRNSANIQKVVPLSGVLKVDKA